MRRRQPPSPPPVPFSPTAVRAHRTGLGLTPAQVAEGMAAHGIRLLPAHVIGWEAGEIRPSEEEFIALSRALWCPPAQLMGASPATLRDFRVARELGQEQTARRIGMALPAYERAEATGRWTGDEEQARELARVLGLGLRTLLVVTDRQEELDRRLRQCVDGRWQGQLKPVARLVPVPGEILAEVLAQLQNDHRVPMHWGASEPGPAERQPEQPLADRFWELLSRHPTDIPV
ncbi:helix-turn-helix transcriptional regulator [Kitasatospora sp. GP82]|uniref:helix-turn-helix domain-containing protein n=1 Tax=Kitasatospora sp. GP82 TaxID=3035089 RepID=UPI0024769773|nr:helix-turn-helix transcriptional regulator [Kitasatospora sp. GP82]MDH6126109.1 transcriptional regulator with XRE-family HTH domain [Kitasatospora sp. GP82]